MERLVQFIVLVSTGNFGFILSIVDCPFPELYAISGFGPFCIIFSINTMGEEQEIEPPLPQGESSTTRVVEHEFTSPAGTGTVDSLHRERRQGIVFTPDDGHGVVRKFGGPVDAAA